MKKWRILVILFVLIGFLSGLIYRLYQIQVSSARSFSVDKKDLIALAEQIQSREVILTSNRGKILDRHGKAFVGDIAWRLFVFPQSKEQLELKRQEFKKVSDLLHIPYKQFEQKLSSLPRPVVLSKYLLTDTEVKTIESLHIPGVVAVESDNRMTDGEVAKEVIGRLIRNSFLLKDRYPEEIADGKFSLQSRFGLTGLEYAFETFLHGEGESLVRFVTDGRGKALNGIQVRLSQVGANHATKPDNIVTTLDLGLQTKVEQVLAKEHVEDGAVVVEEISTGNILAMAGVSDEAGPDDNPWINEALVETTPGSIFKTVVTVAALEEGVETPNSHFVCHGTLGKYHLHDDDFESHGKETLSQAYANSCNVVLGTVAGKLGGAKLEEYAKRLGLDQQIGWSGKVMNINHFRQLPEEETGLIFGPRTSLKDQGAVVQTGIGQHDVKVTPLQAANMITALFHHGMPIEPRIVTEIQDASGKPVWKFVNKYIPTAKPIKTSTLNAVKQMMRMVVTSGTAKSLSKERWEMAGKTGTAQVGVKKDLYNKWMIGFAPYAHPIYSVSVVIKNDKDPSDPRAQRIFREVMEFLRKTS